jgi:HPt (histidine-containing phosphotransfer) domain-containing protein
LLKFIKRRDASVEATVALDAAATVHAWPSSLSLAELQRSGLDVKQVLEMTGLSAASYFVILRKFAAHLPRQMAQLQNALQRQDTEAALHSTHAIKGAASNMGAQQLEIAMRELEIHLERGSAKATMSAFEQTLLLQEALIASIERVPLNP